MPSVVVAIPTHDRWPVVGEAVVYLKRDSGPDAASLNTSNILAQGQAWSEAVATRLAEYRALRLAADPTLAPRRRLRWLRRYVGSLLEGLVSGSRTGPS